MGRMLYDRHRTHASQTTRVRVVHCEDRTVISNDLSVGQDYEYYNYKKIIPHSNKNLARKRKTAASPVDKTRDHKMELSSHWSHSSDKISQKDAQ